MGVCVCIHVCVCLCVCSHARIHCKAAFVSSVFPEFSRNAATEEVADICARTVRRQPTGMCIQLLILSFQCDDTKFGLLMKKHPFCPIIPTSKYCGLYMEGK